MGRPRKNASLDAKAETAAVGASGEEEAMAQGLFAEAQSGEPTAEETLSQAGGYSADEVKALIAKAVAEAMAKAQAPAAAPAGDMVTVLYLDEVSPNSALELPGYGSLRPQSYIEIPKKEFGNKFMGIAIVRKLLERRRLIVMDGLTQEERERWGCDYKDGELLDERTFDKMLDYPTPQLAEIFERLCPEHQKFVATRMITAKEKNDSRISVEKTKRINELSKKNDPNGMLRPVLQAFGAEIAS